jgi:hypothetical protein
MNTQHAIKQTGTKQKLYGFKIIVEKKLGVHKASELSSPTKKLPKVWVK